MIIIIIIVITIEERVPGDPVSRVSLGALLQGLDGHLRLLQLGGLVPARDRPPPPADRGLLPGVVLAGVGRQAGGEDLLGEGDGLAQGQDGEVVVVGLLVVVGVEGDGGETPPVELVVGDLVLAEILSTALNAPLHYIYNETYFESISGLYF